ncbi:MAG: D-glycero-beta-D-manno-heptose-7-phosphate kinase [Bacteroidetes bacterium]|nr:D-glycero-beta-D-manno-heptose-7-phosphate kinase [Bacteroidota bacterium]MBS1540442.1 D-glycero-beta-D-manno-heptose-7-phosphate kinase [Bacteroidota bacterium]
MSIEKLFDSFSSQRVLIIGDVMLDSHIWGSADRISPEAPVPVVQVKKKDFRLGGAGNVAVNIAALGAEAVLCAFVGDDDSGQRIHQLMEELGMTRDGIVVSTHRPSTVKTRVIASHQQVVRIDEESDLEAHPEEEKQLWQRIEKLLPTCQVVIFEDYDKGVLNDHIIAKTVALASQLKIPTVVDPKKRNFLSYKEVTLFKPNLKELREGLKIEVAAANLDQVKAASKLLRQKLNAQGVMVTLSEHGVFIDYQGSQVKLPAHAREIADVSGAGDTVVSVASLCTALQCNAKLIAELSNLAGGLVCQHVGVVPINKEELRQEALKLLSGS